MAILQSVPVKIYKSTFEKFPVLALDPGKTTGSIRVYAEIEWAEGDLVTCRLTAHPKNLSWPAHADELLRYIEAAETVRAEDFRVYDSKARALIGDDMPAPRVLGWIEGCTYMFGNGNFSTAMAAGAKVYTNEDLKTVWPQLPAGRHNKDALRHFHLWLMAEAKAEVKRRQV